MRLNAWVNALLRPFGWMLMTQIDERGRVIDWQFARRPKLTPPSDRERR